MISTDTTVEDKLVPARLGVCAQLQAWLDRRRERKELARLVKSSQWRRSVDDLRCQESASVPAQLGEPIILAGWQEEDGEVLYYLIFEGDRKHLMSFTCCDWGNEGDLLAIRLVNEAAKIAAASK